MNALPPVSALNARQRLLNTLNALGQRSLQATASAARIARLLGGAVLMLVIGGSDGRRVSLNAVLRRVADFGPRAVWLMLQFSFSIGLVFGILLQTSLQWADLLELALGKATEVLVEQIAPLFVAILVAVRNGASLAADLSTMVATREIDALHSLGLSYERLLVAPAILGALLAVPLLTLMMIACIVVTFSVYLQMAQVSSALLVVAIAVNAIEPGGLLIALGKGALFGALIVAIAADKGLAGRPAIRMIGASVTSALVTMMGTILLLNAALSLIL